VLLDDKCTIIIQLNITFISILETKNKNFVKKINYNELSLVHVRPIKKRDKIIRVPRKLIF